MIEIIRKCVNVAQKKFGSEHIFNVFDMPNTDAFPEDYVVVFWELKNGDALNFAFMNFVSGWLYALNYSVKVIDKDLFLAMEKAQARKSAQSEVRHG